MRDRSTLILVLFTPTLLLLLMAYALTVDIKHVPLAVLDYDRTAAIQPLHPADHIRRGPGYRRFRRRHAKKLTRC